MSKVFRLFLPAVLPIVGSVGYLYYLSINGKLPLNLPPYNEATKIAADKKIVHNVAKLPNTIISSYPVLTHKLGHGLGTHLNSKSVTSIIIDLKNPSSNKTKVTNPKIEHLLKTGLFHINL